MSKHMSLLSFILALILFAGDSECSERKGEYFTNKSAAVYDAGIRKGLIVISAEDIPQTDLAEVVVGYKDNQPARPNRFKLITSRSSKPQKGDPVDVVVVCYYINNDEVPGTWRKIFVIKKK